MDSNEPSFALCVHVLDTAPESMIVCVTPHSFAVYRLQPFGHVCHGVVRVKQDKYFRQIVLRADGEMLPTSTQQEVIQCWHDHFVACGHRRPDPHLAAGNIWLPVDHFHTGLEEIIRGTSSIDDDKGVS